MNILLHNLAERACKKINLNYPGDAFPIALTQEVLKDLHDELGKIKWVGEDESWNKAIQSVRQELIKRYNIKP